MMGNRWMAWGIDLEASMGIGELWRLKARIKDDESGRLSPL